MIRRKTNQNQDSNMQLTDVQLSGLCLKLALLLSAGLDAGQSARLIHADDGSLHRAVACISEGADRGMSLHESMAGSGVFPSYVTGLVKAGETSGKLEESLRALSEYYDRQAARKAMIRSSIAYPAVLLCMMLCVVAVLLIKVLPVFGQVYESLGGAMTGLAGSMLQAGIWIRGAAPILLLVLSAVFLAVLAVCFVPRLRQGLSWRFQLKYGDKGVFCRINNAKVAQAMSLGMQSGLLLEDVMDMAAELVVDVPRATDRCRSCADDIRNGNNGADVLFIYGILPEDASEILYLGQQSGRGDQAMAEVARRMSEDADRAVDSLVSKIEPALVLSSCLLVGMILLSVMVPLMDIMSVLG